MLSVGITLIGNYRSRKIIGRTLAMSYQKRLSIKMSISDIQNSDVWRLSAHMIEFTATKRRCACCSTKENEKRTNVIASLVVFVLVGKIVLRCIIETIYISDEMNKYLIIPSHGLLS
jgi:hypothetical protein